MNVKLYNQEGKEQGQTRVPKEVFGLKVKPDLVHQVMVSQFANRRQGTAHSKIRSEVRGGGRKPWRQKGTGRARHGSIRSPLWAGGGVTFGPRSSKSYKKKIPLKMKRKALLMALSAKAQDNLLVLLDSLKISEIKTKELVKVLESLPCERNSCLLALPSIDKNIILSANNIANLETIQAKDLNVLDLLSFKYLLMPKESIKAIEKTFLKTKEAKRKF